MLSFLKVTFLSILLTASLSASDLLSKATNGIISDNDFGIKQLSKDEMSSVKGGYTVVTAVVENNLAIAVAVPAEFAELGVKRNEKTGKLDGLYDVSKVLCALGVSMCYIDKENYIHSQVATNRLMDYIKALGDYKMTEGYLLAFTVKRNVMPDSSGNKNVYFSYETAAYNIGNHTVHPISSSFNLDNVIVKEIRDAYAKSLEQDLMLYANKLGW